MLTKNQRKAQIGVDHANREPNDFYPTPANATEALLAKETFLGPVWEPACGDGAISRVLESHKIDHISSDLVNRGYGDTPVDFLLSTHKAADELITNPPFKLANHFIAKALSLNVKKFAFLMRVAALESEGRRRFFERSYFARLHVFSSRISIYRNGEKTGTSGTIAFGWFVWDQAYDYPRPTISWISNGTDDV